MGFWIEGEGWFKRFVKEHPDARFLRKGQDDKYRYDEMSIKVWQTDNERYIMENNEGMLCASPASILIVEGQELIWNAQSRVAFKVAVSVFNP